MPPMRYRSVSGGWMRSPADTELAYGDIIIVSGRPEQVERFAELP